jgi:hypothetical protein
MLIEVQVFGPEVDLQGDSPRITCNWGTIKNSKTFPFWWHRTVRCAAVLRSRGATLGKYVSATTDN